jgi:hypothetical protein
MGLLWIGGWIFATTSRRSRRGLPGQSDRRIAIRLTVWSLRVCQYGTDYR